MFSEVDFDGEFLLVGDLVESDEVFMADDLVAVMRK